MRRITELYAFVCVGEDGAEGIPATLVGGMWIPMIGADRRRVASLRPLAQDVANRTGRPVRVLRFTGYTQVEEILPKEEP